jgi:integrase
MVERAEVAYRPLMQTRHTYVTLMLQKRAPIDWLQKQMGHRNLTMLSRLSVNRVNRLTLCAVDTNTHRNFDTTIS